MNEEEKPHDKFIQRLDVNPFVFNIDKVVSKNKRVGYFKDKNGYELLDTNNGELKGIYNAIFIKEKVDNEKFIKVFINNINVLFDLNKEGQEVFKYISSKLEKDKDYIYFSLRDCKEYTKYKENKSIYNGINNLIKHGIIAKTEENFKYWINPNIIFNGNRLAI
jgi:hypothetical protein